MFFSAPAAIARSRAATAESRRVLTAMETGAPVGAAGGATRPVGAGGGGFAAAPLDGSSAVWPGAYTSSSTTAASAPSTPIRAFIDACVISFNIGRGSGVQRPSGCVASSSAPDSAARICCNVDIIWPADS